MALKRQNEMLATFSMASMTDVIFLLLIFFMVTSTFVMPTAMEVNLPQGSSQAAIKPGTKVYIDKDLQIYGTFGDNEPQLLEGEEQLLTFLQLQQQKPQRRQLQHFRRQRRNQPYRSDRFPSYP